MASDHESAAQYHGRVLAGEACATLPNLNEARRRESSKALILSALQAAGPVGCSNSELNDISFRYGGRICELRKAGYRITSIDEGDGRWRFVLDTMPTLRTLPPPVAYLDHTGRARTLPTETPSNPPDGLLFDL